MQGTLQQSVHKIESSIKQKSNQLKHLTAVLLFICKNHDLRENVHASKQTTVKMSKTITQ